MEAVKNILVGFIVSFIGSIPLGYLNIIGFEMYAEFGINSLIYYLLGVISIEVFVIYFTLIFANKLVTNIKLMKIIDIAAIFFLLFLAYSFYAHVNKTASGHNYLARYRDYSPFLIGIILNSLNFLQIPFWTGWNLYLINEKHITIQRTGKYFYIFGTVMGIFLGMFSLVLILESVVKNTGSFSKYIVPVFIPVFFTAMALFQIYKVYKKYFAAKNP